MSIGQELMLAIQLVIYHHEGSINKFVVDDKGILVLCVFGLPPMAHSDDPKRAVGAAQMLIEVLGREDFKCSIGVTSGKAFCGVIGSPDRREYTVMGNIVNLAARLMMEAKDMEVLVDRHTRDNSSSSIEYESCEPLALKGFEVKIDNFRPLKLKQGKVSKKSKLTLDARADVSAIMLRMTHPVPLHDHTTHFDTASFAFA